MRARLYNSPLALAVLSALLLWMALPPLDFWPLAWIAPVGWVMLVRLPQLPGRRPYRNLLLVGFGFWLATVYWVGLAYWMAWFGLPPLAFYLALYLPLFVALARTAVHSLRVPVIIAAPVIWTGLELARGHLLGGFTMASLGHTQYRWLALIQISDLVGAYGVSFLVMFVSASLARMLPVPAAAAAGQLTAANHSPGHQSPPQRFSDGRLCLWPLLPAAAAVGLSLVYGHWRISDREESAAIARVALIQGSIDTEIKFDEQMRNYVYEHYQQLSRRALQTNRSPDNAVHLMVWPETMFRYPLLTYEAGAAKPPQFEGTQSQFAEQLQVQSQQSLEQLAQAARSYGVHWIVGIDRWHFTAAGRIVAYNSAAFVSPDGRLLACYDKMHPVLFGEYWPLLDRFPELEKRVPLGVSIAPGAAPVCFELPGPHGPVRLSPNICYETVLPHLFRQQVLQLRAAGAEPDVLVNLTNDGWFRGSSELDLHLACAPFRAIECRKPLLIAANTGFSAWIDGDGRILRKGPRRDTDVIIADVQRDHRHSLYLECGDWFAGLCLAGCVAAAIGGLFCRWFANPRRS
jgi:apolipoprotein N-acyltransferase